MPRSAWACVLAQSVAEEKYTGLRKIERGMLDRRRQLFVQEKRLDWLTKQTSGPQ